MNPDEADAVDAFERLGLTSYEAKVYIALQRVGSGTARDVARVTDVPRSQIYSTAENLAERGLIEIQQSNPIRYRAVSVDQARRILEDRFERERDRAFTFVDAVRAESAGEEEQEDVWTVRGDERVSNRVVELVAAADRRVIFGARVASLFSDDIADALVAKATEGVDVVVVSREAAIRNAFADNDEVSTTDPPLHTDDDRSGRIVMVDDDRILLSVVDDAGEETAIWSAESRFASVLIQLIEASDVSPTA